MLLPQLGARRAVLGSRGPSAALMGAAAHSLAPPSRSPQHCIPRWDPGGVARGQAPCRAAPRQTGVGRALLFGLSAPSLTQHATSNRHAAPGPAYWGPRRRGTMSSQRVSWAGLALLGATPVSASEGRCQMGICISGGRDPGNAVISPESPRAPGPSSFWFPLSRTSLFIWGQKTHRTGDDSQALFFVSKRFLCEKWASFPHL